MNEKPIEILHLGHFGVGGIYGLCPENKEVNDGQKWLTEIKRKVLELVPNPDVIIFGGELLEGRNVKNHQEDIFLSLEEQIDGAVKLMREFISENTKEIIIPFAHDYHGSSEMRIENIIRDRLKDSYPDKSIVSGTYIERKYLDKTFRFIHGSGGGTQRLLSKPESDIRMNLQQYALDKANKIDRYYSYHTHRLAEGGIENIRNITCPAFKLTDTGGQMRNPDAWLPDVGVLITTVEEKYGEVRVRDDPVIFKPSFHIEELENTVKNWIKDNIMLKETNIRFTSERDLILPS